VSSGAGGKPGSTMSEPLVAALYMLGAMAFFSTMGVFIKLAAEQVHIFEVVFFRNFLAVLFMVPWLIRQGPGVLKTKRIGLYTTRSLFNIVGMVAGFTSMTLIPLAEATALSFTAPLFATIGAAFILGEVVRIRRITALAIGFVGMLIVLRPGVESISLGAVLSVVNAATIAATIIIVKMLTSTEPPETIVTYMVLLQTPMALIPALYYWTWPDPMTWIWLIGLAGAGTAGHLAFTKAIKMAEVTQIQPLDFVRLPIIAVLAYFVFDQVPTIWTWIGGAVIFASTAYVTHREAQLAREGRRAASRET
jgi:drug/metabolite transporter (DMT)-like permease